MEWQKIKVREKKECRIIGYTKGSGGRKFGALLLAEESEEGYTYRGRVGTGFSQDRMAKLYELLTSLDETGRPSYAPEDKEVTWVEPLLAAVVSYNEIQSNGTFRAAVFEKLVMP